MKLHHWLQPYGCYYGSLKTILISRSQTLIKVKVSYQNIITITGMKYPTNNETNPSITRSVSWHNMQTVST